MLLWLVLLKENRVIGLKLGLLLGFWFRIFVMVLLGIMIMLYIWLFNKLIVCWVVLKKLLGVVKLILVKGVWVWFNVVLV